MQLNASNLMRLENSACIEAYSNQLISTWRNVLLVSNSTHVDSVYASIQVPIQVPLRAFSSNIFSAPDEDNLSWLCASSGLEDYYLCRTQYSPAGEQILNVAPDKWSFNSTSCNHYGAKGQESCLSHSLCLPEVQEWTITIDHCLAEPIQEYCRLHLNTSVLLIVILCNLIKGICLLSALLITGFTPLVTVGDAIASFLIDPDTKTIREGSISAVDIANGVTSASQSLQLPSLSLPTNWENKPRRWSRSATNRRWCTTFFL